jgi:predicted NBD/HSP70 family sugar kinase
VIRREEIRKEHFSEAELMESVFQLLEMLFAEEQNVVAIGVASIGPVNVSEGMIVNPYYFHDIHDVKIRKMIEERYKLPVFFDHDNQSAALAESLYGNGRNYQDMLLVSVSRGVGCGIIVQGHRIHSSYGYAPEIGHISLDHNGKTCFCGNRGCLELYVNSDHVRNRLMAVTGKDLSYDGFMAVTEDPDVDHVMLECVDNLTSALISVINILNTQLILLGMDCCLWPDRYIERIEEEINRVKFGNKNIRIPVKKTYFMRDSQLLGAACNGINAMFHGDIPGLFDRP